jgi:hypothetical protein
MFKNLLLVFSLVANGVAAWWLAPSITGSIGGPKYDLSKPDDLTALRRLIYQCAPLLQTLDGLHHAKSKYPGHLNEVSFSPPHYKQEMIDSYLVTYGLSEDRSSFWLHLKLNWDATLRFESASRQWSFDPGDGRKGTLIQP